MVRQNKSAVFWIKIVATTAVVGLICLCFALNLAFPLKYSSIVQRESTNFNLEPKLVYATIWTESKFKSDAVSKAGAMGLMQLMPSTARFCAQELGEAYSDQKLLDPAFNIRLGAFYLSYLLAKFGDEQTAIAAYNAGEGNVTKWLDDDGQIKFKETRDYIHRVNLAKKIYSIKT